MGQVHARSLPASSRETKEVWLETIPAQVKSVYVDGLERTEEDVVMDRVKAIFKASQFEELVLTAQNVRNELRDMGCFSDVSLHIDTSEAGGPRDYDVTFKVKELSRFKGSVNTMVGNQEGSLLIGLRSPNVLGRGEQCQVEYTHGTKKTTAFHANLIKPLLLHPSRAVLTGSLFQQMAEYPPSGFRELNRGISLDVGFESLPQVQHNLQYEASWRDLRALNRSVAFSVREHAGHTLKSSLRHVLTVDRRDHPVFPSSGSLLRWSQEFAGLGGDVGFFKTALDVQANVPLADDVVLQATFSGGLLHRPDPDKTATIADRFFLGGPHSVRGFELRGIGPASDGNSLGSSAFLATGLHLFGPLPFRLGRGGFGDLFRTHFFLNAGNTADAEQVLANDMGRNWNELADRMRLSYGLGLAFKLGGIARIELNYCIPAWSLRGDRPAPGLQLGVGVNFL